CLTVSSVAAGAPAIVAASKPVAMMILFMLPSLVTDISLVIDASQRGIDGRAEPVDDHINIAWRADVGWRQQHMVAVLAVRRAAARLPAKAPRERTRLDPLIELETRIEGFPCGAISNQSARLEQAAPADVADMAVVAEASGQPPLQMPAQF